MQEAQGLTLRDILNVIYKRIFILKIVVVLLPIGVFIGCLLATPVYQVDAKIIVTAKKDESSLLQGTTQGTSRIVNLNIDEIDLNSEMEILKSPDLWSKTVEALGPNFFKSQPTGIFGKIKSAISTEITNFFQSPKEPENGESREQVKYRALASSLMSRFDVTPVPRSKILDLSFKDSDPNKVQKILSTLLTVYIPFHSQVYSIPGVQSFFAEQLAASKAKYDLLRDKMVNFKKKWELSVPERQETDLISTLKLIEDSLIDVNSGLRQYSKIVTLLNKGDFPTGQLAPGGQRGGESTLINVLAVQVVQAAQKQGQVGEIFASNSRDYRAAADQYNETLVKFKTVVASESSILEIKKASLEESRKTVLAQMKNLSEKSEKLRAIQLEVSVAREQYLQFVGKEQAARLESTEGRQKLVDVKVLGEPYPPKKPIFPKTGLYVILAFLFSFPLGIGIIFVATFLDHSFDDPSRLEAATGYRVLASFGKVKKDEPPGDSK
ncbi:MAG: Wzz/FepE/Etk N-terminal domain-containing protein [Deltaproteobacteria bacterium]|nr:Wzz/FepE/Etk N-terminal domain-containing protein [Deltaproteobacteria bacterium]